jgi:hypothetical protein
MDAHWSGWRGCLSRPRIRFQARVDRWFVCGTRKVTAEQISGSILCSKSDGPHRPIHAVGETVGMKSDCILL